MLSFNLIAQNSPKPIYPLFEGSFTSHSRKANEVFEIKVNPLPTSGANEEKEQRVDIPSYSDYYIEPENPIRGKNITYITFSGPDNNGIVCNHGGSTSVEEFEFTVGETIGWAYANYNNGTTNITETWEDYIRLRLGSVVKKSYTNVNNGLPASNYRVWSNMTHTFTEPGTYYLYLTRDVGNDVVETNESDNNGQEGPIYVSQDSADDIVPDVEYIEINGIDVSNGNSVSIELDSNNQFEIKLRGENDGSDTVPPNLGGMHVSIEEFTNSYWKNNIEMDSSTSNDLEGHYNEYFGSEANGGDGYANYVMVEAYDTDGWTSNESNNLYLNVNPGSLTQLHIHYRVMFSNNEDDWYFDPSSGNPGPIGDPTYEIIVNIVPPDDGNGTPGTATPLNVVSSYQGDFEINPVGDIDWYRFDAPPYTQITLNTELINGSEIDPEFYFYGPNSYSTLIENNDDGPGSLQPEIEYTTGSSSATYYLRVAHYSNDPSRNDANKDHNRATTGDYRLHISFEQGSTPTRFRGDHFVDKTCKYGIPILLEAKLEQDNSWLNYPDISNKQISFFIRNNTNNWTQVQDDGISETSFITDSNGIARVYYTAPTDYYEGFHEIKAVFYGDQSYGACEIVSHLNIHKPQWLYMVYLCADNNLEAAGVWDFYGEMWEGRNNNEVSIVVLMDRHTSSSFPNYSGSHDNWTTCRYFRVSSDNRIYNDWGEVDMGSSTTLTNFITQATNDCVANNVSLTFWNHGSGWVREDYDLSVASTNSLHQERSTPELAPMQETDNNPSLRYVCSDDDAGNGQPGGHLTMSEIRSVLGNYDTFNIIGFDACLMGMVEVAYDLHPYGDYIIASEEEEGADGWEYQHILTEDNITSSTTSEQLGQETVEAFFEYYDNGPTLGCWNIQNSNIIDLANDISGFAERLIELLPEAGTRNHINSARSNARKFSAFINGDSIYVDLRQFAIELASLSTDYTLITKANSIVNRLSNSEFRTSWQTSYENSLGGLSLYLPPHRSGYEWPWYHVNDVLDFTSESNQKWDDFLRCYFDILPPNLPEIVTCSHSSETWSNDDTISIEWTCEDGGGSGIVGYSYEWSQSPSTIPISTSQGSSTSTTSPSLSNANNWYFHVRAVDQAGNWSVPEHCGPFYIDDAPPITPIIASCSHNPEEWDNDDTISIEWGSSDYRLEIIESGLETSTHSQASLDTRSVAGYSYEWSQTSSTEPNNISQGSSTSTNSPSLANGNNWYFHVKAVDLAGNWSDIRHYGPFYIDDISPGIPSITSCSHDLEDWDNDDNIAITWSFSDTGGSGLGGYSHEWSQSSTTIPNNTSQGSTNATTSPSLTNAQNWYFHVKSIDQAGNWGETRHHGPFYIDDASPSGSVSINNGNPATSSLIVTLNLLAQDNGSGVDKMCFSNNGSVWSNWINYNTISVNWDISLYGGNEQTGIKTVYAKFRDHAGNISSVVSDQIDYAGSIATPDNVSISVTSDIIHLSWTEVTSANSYKVFASILPNDLPFENEVTELGWFEYIGSQVYWHSSVFNDEKMFFSIRASSDQPPIRSR